MKKIILSMFLLTTLALADSWNKQVNGEVNELEELKVTEVTKIYTGDSVENDKIFKAPEGKKYVFVPFKVSKNGTGKDMFDSYELILVTKNAEYERLEDDEFLDEFKISSFPHLRIKLGEHSGIIVYEIDSTDSLAGAYLKYNDERIELKESVNLK